MCGCYKTEAEFSGLHARHPYYPHTSGISVMTILIPPSRGLLRTLVGRSEETSTRVSTGVRTSTRARVLISSPTLPAQAVSRGSSERGPRAPRALRGVDRGPGRPRRPQPRCAAPASWALLHASPCMGVQPPHCDPTRGLRKQSWPRPVPLEILPSR